MPIANLPQEKPSDGYLPMALSKGDPKGLITSRDKVTELWSLLEYYYDISSARDKFLKEKGILDKRMRQKVGPIFSSYMLQARNFYTYAAGSDYRSAALLYYYSFLNLAKAKIIIEDPTSMGKKFVHGIKRKVEKGGLENISSIVDFSNSGSRVCVFGRLYELRFGRPLLIKAIKIQDLLAYSTDIAHEFQLVAGRRTKVGPVKYQLAVNNARQKTWAKIAICDWGKFSIYKRSFSRFFEEFQEVNISSLTREHNFKISPWESMWYRYFESKIEHNFIGNSGINHFSADEQLKRVFCNQFQEEIYDPNTGFQLVEPLRINLQIPFDEITGIYATMHHLSEIVRYDPHYLEVLLSSKSPEGWLLKSFIESSPQTFLLRMASWITGNHYRLVTR